MASHCKAKYSDAEKAIIRLAVEETGSWREAHRRLTAAGFDRDAQAVRKKAERMGVDVSDDPEGMGVCLRRRLESPEAFANMIMRLPWRAETRPKLAELADHI